MVALAEEVLLGFDLIVFHLLELHLPFFFERVVVLRKHIIELLLLHFGLFIGSLI